MHCSDLERYLEATLDGRLGRSRATILRRHLSICRPCRERVGQLQRFELELRQRFRSMADAESAWAGLNTDLVASQGRATADGSLPPPPAPSLPRPARRGSASRAPLHLPPGSRARITPSRLLAREQQGPEPAAGQRGFGLSRWIGGFLLLAALGTLGQWGWSQFGAADEAVLPSDFYAAYLDGEAALDFRTTDAASLENWFALKLGEPFPELPLPSDFELVGGRVGTIAGEDAALIVYSRDNVPSMLVIRPKIDGSKAALIEELKGGAAGLHGRGWQDGDYAYTLVSALPEDKLALFGR